ncbi:hypothetical protein L211DRAFT_841018, partial [Terfezia boudieri ATCC MYA-4762]
MEAIHERQRGVWVLRIISIGASKAIGDLPVVIENAVEGKAAEGERRGFRNLVILGAAALEAVL